MDPNLSIKIDLFNNKLNIELALPTSLQFEQVTGRSPISAPSNNMSDFNFVCYIISCFEDELIVARLASAMQQLN